METISSLRFNFTRKGELRAELTLAGADGARSYPRIANANAAIKAATSAGAEIRGYKREIALKSAEAIAANGGKASAVVAEYATTPVRCTLTVLGDYAVVDLTSVRLAGATSADAAEVKALVASVPLVAVAARAAKSAPASEDNDLA
jgi:acetylornithine deacetylase/succinyl-diaminopimelate desuccinylase-like protein